MKKAIILALICATLCISTACKNSDNDAETSNTDSETTTTEVTTEETSTEATTEETTVSADDQTDSQYKEIFDSIKDACPGTAGCSLKEAISAAKILMWTSKNEYKAEDVSKAEMDYYNALDSASAEDYKSAVEVVTDTAKDMIKDFASFTDVLDSAGVLDDYKDFTPEEEKSTAFLDALAIKDEN